MFPHLPFEPEQFELCYRAYTAALLDIQNQRGRLKAAPLDDDTRLMVALRIIEASANGERDLSGLQQFALGGLTARQ